MKKANLAFQATVREIHARAESLATFPERGYRYLEHPDRDSAIPASQPRRSRISIEELLDVVVRQAVELSGLLTRPAG